MPNDGYDFIDERYMRKPDVLYTAPPKSTEGEDGETRIVKERFGTYMYVKANNIWYRFFDINSDKVILDSELHVRGLRLTDTTWDDMRAPAQAINGAGANAPDWSSTYVGWLFDDVVDETVQLALQMPHNWKQGSTIYPHIHWMPMNTNSGNVVWEMNYKWTNVGEVEGTSFTTDTVTVAAGGTARMHKISAFSAIDGTGMTLSSMFSVQLSRLGSDGSDTFNTDTLLKEFDIHYEIDGFGSEEEYEKISYKEYKQKGVIT